MRKLPFTEINNLLTKWASNTPLITDFTVENVLSSTNLDFTYYDGVLKYLMSKEGFELIPQKTLICSCNYKVQSFELDHPIDDETIYYCNSCGEGLYFDLDNTILTFSFTEEFIADSLKKKLSLNKKLLATV
ncbi:hypothetical protein [Priestia flexa]|uniref:hypothetical protein n=1 Tax=Priestia flexa TaxID=86664 RepID=UPI0011A16711|nr:hypothetical protein [Priestia flexa]